MKSRPLSNTKIKEELMNGLNYVLSYIMAVDKKKFKDQTFFQLIKFFASSKLKKWRDLTFFLISNQTFKPQTPQNIQIVLRNLKSKEEYNNYYSILIFLGYFFTENGVAISDKIKFENEDYYINPQPKTDFKPLKHFAKILHSVCLYIMHIFYFF